MPKNNGAETLYTIEPGGREDAEVISDGLDRYCDQFVKDEHDYIPVGKKLVDGEGGLIAGVAADVDGWNGCYVNGVWVEEAYRGRGLGSRLLREAERAAKESGAYVMQTHACDWNVGFFLKNGYTVRGELEDYPTGHRAYELEKRI